MSGTVLDEILAHKREEVAHRKTIRSVADIKSQIAEQDSAEFACRGFTNALLTRHQANQPAVIAEIKRASPSKGLIREDFDPPAHARSYAQGGAACLSVLTDEKYFQGHDNYLVAARAAVDIPVLRKDFVVDEYQIYEARALGADCVLLIVAALDIMALTNLYWCTVSVGIDALIEVHNDVELEAALSFSPKLVGINNRNLKTFATNINNTLDLLGQIPPEVMVVTESGISSKETVTQMRSQGVNGFLVGEALMRQPDPGQALHQMFYG